eukprot:3437804-Pleurochrysis_carterae.AAC.2
MAARFDLLVRVQQAHGAVSKRRERAQANMMMTIQTVSAELRAMGNVTDGLRVSPEQLLQYSYYDRFVGQAARRKVPLARVFAAGGGLSERLGRRLGWRVGPTPADDCRAPR